MLEAEKSFRRLKAHKQLPILRGRVAAPSASVLGDQLRCQQKSGSIEFNQWRLLHQFQQAPGLSGHALPLR